MTGMSHALSQLRSPRVPLVRYVTQTVTVSTNIALLQQAEKVSSIHSLPEEHRHRFVHSHRGELAGSIVGTTHYIIIQHLSYH